MLASSLVPFRFSSNREKALSLCFYAIPDAKPLRIFAVIALAGAQSERAMKEAAPEIGDRMDLGHCGSEPVRLPNGQMVERHAWKVQNTGKLAYSQLENRLSRSDVKETTLDYTSDFAERRGFAEAIGVRSEIELRPTRETAQGQIRVRREHENLSQSEKIWSRPLWVEGAGGGRDQPREAASADRLRSPAEKNKGRASVKNLCLNSRRTGAKWSAASLDRSGLTIHHIATLVVANTGRHAAQSRGDTIMAGEPLSKLSR